MARLTQAPSMPRSNPASLADLARLLGRLQQNVLQADVARERRLLTSEYERTKAGINLEYARTLITRLEHDALDVKVTSRRHAMQSDLSRKRALFERISERLRELDELSIDSDDGHSDDDDEDLLAGVVQTPGARPHSPSSSRSARWVLRGQTEPEEAEEEAEDDDESTVMPERRRSALSPATTETPAKAASKATAGPTTATTQTLHLRASTAAPAPPSQLHPSGSNAAAATTTSASPRSQLFGNRPPSRAHLDGPPNAAATTEALLDHHRSEQDALTSSLLSMASALKSSSTAFATSLSEERGSLLGAAASGLDRSATGLEAAARRMGALRRMTESRGWLGRVYLFVYVYVLMFVVVAVVLFLPKLRF